MAKIMIIEDDPTTRNELTLLLENEGYQIMAVTEFINITEQLQAFDPHLVLLDLCLPGEDGFILCMKLRKVSHVPVIFITSKDSAMDELRGLSLGGDDYITKPYHVPVLLARIKIALRRGTGTAAPDMLEGKGLTLSLSKGIASANGRTTELTRNELKILTYLLRHSGEIVSRADLIEALWDEQIYIDDNTLSVNMTRLRGKLDEIRLPGFIRTRRGMGYQI